MEIRGGVSAACGEKITRCGSGSLDGTKVRKVGSYINTGNVCLPKEVLIWILDLRWTSSIWGHSRLNEFLFYRNLTYSHDCVLCGADLEEWFYAFVLVQRTVV